MCELCKMALNKTQGEKRDSQKPWATDPINVALPSWETSRDKMENLMMEVGLGDYIIDEIAIMFDHRARMGEFVSDAVMGDGVKLFNRAFDHVNVNVFNVQYDVEYFFLETRSTMRVECMALNNGFSPVHFAVGSHLDERHPLSVVHMSFKVAPEESVYAEVCEVLGENFQLVQSCTSTYGAFSYYHVPGDLSGVYLKPRINLRDNYMDRGEFGMPGLGQPMLPFIEKDGE